MIGRFEQVECYGFIRVTECGNPCIAARAFARAVVESSLEDSFNYGFDTSRALLRAERALAFFSDRGALAACAAI
jgi:hypothetical protein